ncbi:MAG: RNA polymerase sigma factor [Lachnospiraceae bacterium]|nr:RNA polymerase sigma factor [Lachnospiraceae bacterium]
MSNVSSDLEAVINKYSDMLYKICFVILKDEHDVKDVLQETFLAYHTKNPILQSEEHKKAWLIKVSQNKCREFLRFHKRHSTVPLDNIDETTLITNGLSGEESDLLSLVWNLNYKLKSVVILYYIEGYSIDETARILSISSHAAKKRLERARKKLKQEYEEGLVYEK